MLKRSSGILLPIFSLPSKYGIGTLGKEAYKFIDFLRSAGQSCWQVLPLGPTSYGDSPYSPFSVFAGNPYFIDLEILLEEGFLEEGDLDQADFGGDDYIDYKKLFDRRCMILRKAYLKRGRFLDMEAFVEENPWTEDYALFMALKCQNNYQAWYKWEEKLLKRDGHTLKRVKNELSDEMHFWIFLQYLFFKQYFKLKEYADKSGISIIGDLPIYVAEDSVDVWAETDLFMADEKRVPTCLAGVPPDSFSEEGQLWGNPVYRWDYLKESHYEWWIKRIEFSFKLYDLVRLDHFRGFDEFWAVPYGSENAVKGRWLPAHGKEMFQKVNEKLGSVNIIAEDLGIITDRVIELKKTLGFPGMKVLQFAFDGNPDNPYLPANYEENSVAYTGTHDNDTLKGWYEKLRDEGKSYVLKSLNIQENLETDQIVFKMIEALYDSKARLCIVPIQDFLALGSEARINTPSTLGNNWTWRLKPSMLTQELAEKIKNITHISNRQTR